MAVHSTFSSAFKVLYRKIDKVKSDLPTVLANEGTKFFVSNFDLEGFTNVGFSAWKPRKVKPKKGNKKILVQSGRLRRAVSKSVTEKSFKRIVWRVNKSEVPYAEVHNNGEIVSRKPHKRTATIKSKIKTASFKNGKLRHSTKTISLMGARHNVSASTFKMPRRHFMGKSEFLNKRFKLRIKEAYVKAFTR